MKITGNEPAFPFLTWNEAGYGETITVETNAYGKSFFPYTPGITIRQYLVGKVMQGLAAGPSCKPDYAVHYADKLIEALNKIPNPNE